jgi:small subunit ribosomal protein S3
MGKVYRGLVLEDFRIRQAILEQYKDFSEAGIASIAIDRGAQDIVVSINSARPGILIGRDGERVKQLRLVLEQVTGKRMQLNILEVSQPELNAYLVAKSIAEQLERRVSHRRAMRQATQRAMQAGAQGIKIILGGRIMGAEIARREKLMVGRVPLHTLRADIDFAVAEALTIMGKIGVKAWIYRGEVLPVREQPSETMQTIEVTVRGEGREDVAAQEGQVPQDAPRPS